MNTTKMSTGSGTVTVKHADTFHVAAGLHYVPTPSARITIGPSEFLTVELSETPADSITFSGTLIYEEIG